jgi:hypothetical protein
MSTLLDPHPFVCISCEAPIQGSPTFFVGLAFCCAGCVAGGPCTCSYDPEPLPAHRAPMAHGGTAPSEEVGRESEEPAVSDEPGRVPVSAGALQEPVAVR